MKSYFPDSKIIGVDINKGNLRKAVSKSTSNDIQFLFSTPKTIGANGHYDLIFCLSVLCRWEDTKDLANCEKVYSFKKFTETVGFLAGQLLTGGLLIIYNSKQAIFMGSDQEIALLIFQYTGNEHIAEGGLITNRLPMSFLIFHQSCPHILGI